MLDSRLFNLLDLCCSLTFPLFSQCSPPVTHSFVHSLFSGLSDVVSWLHIYTVVATPDKTSSLFPFSSCSLKWPGVSCRPRCSLSCLAVSLVGSLKPWSHSSDYLGSAYKVSISSEVLGSFAHWKSWSPFLLRSCLVLGSPSGFIACLAVAPFCQRLQRSSSIVRLHDLLRCWYLGPVVVSLSLDWLSREYLFIFYPFVVLSFFAAFLIPQRISPNGPSDCWLPPF